MNFVRFCLMVPIVMPYTMELSVMIAVACCGCPISLRIFRIASSSLALYYNAPHSTPAANDITLRMMFNMTIIALSGRLLSLHVPPI